MFEPQELDALAPRRHAGPSLAEVNGDGVQGLDPLAATEAIAYDFLAKGGKHSRPFITLAVYDALTGGRGTQDNAAAHFAQFPAAVKRCACRSRPFTKPRWYTTTFKMTINFATERRRCIAASERRQPLTWEII